MILFDTRGPELRPAPAAAMTGRGIRRLRELAHGLDIPPLVPVPPDHVLTKSFYLLQRLPRPLGRRRRSGSSAATDRVNDGVSSVIIGGNDWAGAWAVDDRRPAAASRSCPAASASARWPIASASTS